MAEAAAIKTDEPLKRLKRRRDNAQKVRDEFQPLIDDAYKYAIPFRRDASDGRGAERVSEVYDHTAIVSAFRFAGKLQTDLAPPGETFFRLEPGPLVRDPQVKEGLAAELTGIRDIIGSSLLDGEWDNAFAEMALDLSAGTGVMLVLPGEGDKIARFIAVPLSEVLLESGGYQEISGIFWKRKWSLRAIAEQWPKGDFGEKLKTAMETNENEEIDLHQDTVWDAKARRWVHTVWCEKQDQAIAVTRSRTCPWLTPRYFKVSGETYGRGVVMLAMPTIRTANTAQRYTLQAAAIAMLGIFTAIDDGVFNPELSPIAPGAFWKVARNGGTLGPSVQRFPEPRIDLSNIILNDLRMGIQAAMMDQSLPPDGASVRSATEILERVKRLASDHLGAFGRLVAEIIVPLVRRLIEISHQRRVIRYQTPIDQLLVRVAVSSPLAMARETSRVQKIVQWLEIVMALLPQKAHHVAKIAAALAEIGRAMDVPPEFIVTAEERAAAEQNDEIMAAGMAALDAGLLAPGAGGAGATAEATPEPVETAA